MRRHISCKYDIWKHWETITFHFFSFPSFICFWMWINNLSSENNTKQTLLMNICQLCSSCEMLDGRYRVNIQTIVRFGVHQKHECIACTNNSASQKNVYNNICWQVSSTRFGRALDFTEMLINIQFIIWFDTVHFRENVFKKKSSFQIWNFFDWVHRTTHFGCEAAYKRTSAENFFS